MKEITISASDENLNTVLDFISTELEAYNCPMKTSMQIAIAVEEIFVNIAHYAYNSEIGSATIACKIEGEPLLAYIYFIDSGKPYNPLEKNDPDVTLSAEEREIGGLGFYIVKKTMDDVFYEYKDGKNILTVKKEI